jgi:hypothetical protein
MSRIYIGLDDTDNPDSRGTGHLARLLAEECRARGLAPAGVTRHQFLLDPRIPYTSHNSGACVAVEGARGAEELDFAFDFVAQRSAEGSDPGVCIAEEARVGADLFAFGLAAATRVLEMEGAHKLARAAGIPLRGLGGTCLGVIGALASVGQRAQGSEGRYIDLPGLREMPRRVRAGAFASLGISLEHSAAGKPVAADDDDEYDTLDWVRPALKGGRPVLTVLWSEEHNAWIPADRRKSRPLE